MNTQKKLYQKEKDKIYKLAKDKLPMPEEYPHETIRIPVQFNRSPVMVFSELPDFIDGDFYEVSFKKMWLPPQFLGDRKHLCWTMTGIHKS